MAGRLYWSAGKKLKQWVRWLLGEGPQYCEKACDEYRSGAPTCSVCPRPQVLPENVAAINIFNRCLTQWRWHPNGRISGLDYAAVVAVMQACDVENQDAALQKIQIMEAAALKLVHSKNDDAN